MASDFTMKILSRNRRLLHFEAFTLVELLSACAVVTILAALLIPGVGRMRDSAKNAKCISNLRSIGAALGSFAADNDGKIPPRTVMAPSVPTNPPEPERYWTSRLVRHGYISNPDMLYCPSCFPYRHANATKKLEDDGGQTYGMRVWGPAGQDWSLRQRDHLLSSIERPSDFFLIADSVWMTWSAEKLTQGYGLNPSSDSRDNQRVHLRHGGLANALFADFHVEAKPGSYFTEYVPENQSAYTDNRKMAFQVLQ